MKLTSLTGLATVLALAGCASPNADAPPSALGRTPINSNSGIAAYQAQQPAPNLTATDTRIERQVNDLSRQVGELKAYLVMLQANQEQAGFVPAAYGQTAHMPKHSLAQTTQGQKAAISAPSLSMSIGHDLGASKFSLSEDEAVSFVAAAKASGHITIRGRSDGNKLTPQAKALAIDRAVRVKAFLMSQGVSGDNIRITYCTHGCQVADGATADGRRLNRQTIVELRSPMSLYSLALAQRE
ncbi:OmpA family protein [Asticcacaulis benevestitus]|uniref:OmpA-like domain-containing protein n=1 Tax=Asticcacaulis benevestitus DSM 16100 = ATCC BAA-896 TaxID=1121022 RepID=V4PW42_9CAUL|nr:OmpA family protein [Asticcacaulis benevestitus]ESQ92566.1 hypothetical protein ABENE_07975 [Asticcacaulis benevestitus DSM 16100 = ATCC BAA-896]